MMVIKHPVVRSMGFLLCLLSANAWAVESPRDPGTYFFDQSLGDFPEELEVAREEGKKGILIFFEMNGCPFCQRMKETVLNQPHVQDWFRDNFLCLSVDVEGATEITDFQGKTMTAKDFAVKVNRVRATPVIAFYDLEGKQVVRYTGATKDSQEFLWLGEFAARGLYKTTDFTQYRRKRRAALKEEQGAR